MYGQRKSPRLVLFLRGKAGMPFARPIRERIAEPHEGADKTHALWVAYRSSRAWYVVPSLVCFIGEPERGRMGI
jgi:hypothetical protein